MLSRVLRRRGPSNQPDDQELDVPVNSQPHVSSGALASVPDKLNALRQDLRRKLNERDLIPIVSSSPDAKSGSGGSLLGTFILAVVLPTVLAFLYYAVWASDVFVAEAKLTVKQAVAGGAKTEAGSILGGLGIGSINLGKAQATTQDAMMILDYIKSRAIVQDVGGKERMASIYAKPSVDWFSRMDPDNNLEENWEYWKERVTVSVDTVSSILTLRVRAYTPEDALKLAQAIVAKSEVLINELSRRNRKDAMTRAEEEVQRAAEKLVDARASVLAFQQRSGSIDPLESAKRITENVSALTLQKIDLETQIATASANGVAGRPGEKYIQSRLAAVNKQLAILEDRLTGPTNADSLSAQLKDYQLLRLQEEFSERMYSLARSSYEEARRNLDRQQLYVAVIVPPLLPEYALYPRIFADTGLVFLSCLVLWGIAGLLIASVKDSVN